MIQRKKVLMGFALLSAMLFLTFSTDCRSQDLSRAQRWEVFLGGQYTTSASTTISSDLFSSRETDSDVQMDDSYFLNLGAGYNFSDHLNLNGQVWFGDMDYTRDYTLVYGFPPVLGFRPVSSKDVVRLVGIDCNVDWNILKTPLSPMISGGIGYINSDADIGDSDVGKNSLSYNIGAGLRWDIGERFLLKTMYRFTRADLLDHADYVTLDGVSMNFGYVF